MPAHPLVLCWGGRKAEVAFENARNYMKIIALFYTLCFVGNTFAGYFDGIGRVSIPLIGAASHITLRVILSWLLVGSTFSSSTCDRAGWILVNTMWASIKCCSEKR